jgi:rhamnosyltransferase subunit B
MAQMKIIVIALGSDGDINPMIEISLVLKARGHEVEFLANGHFAKRVKAAGLTFVEVGEARLYEEALNTPHVWDARKGFAAVWSVINQSLPITYKVIKERLIPGQTIMVGTTLALVARMVQEETGTPLVTVHLAPSCIISQHQPPVGPDGSLPQSTPLFLKRLYVSMLDNLILDKACKDDINNFRKPLGLPPVKQVFSKWLHSPTKVVGAFPPWFGEPQLDWPPNAVCTGFPVYRSAQGSELSRETQDFINGGAPPIVFTAGSAMAQSSGHFKTALDSIAGQNTRAILISKFADQVPKSLADHVHHSLYEPFDLLFPLASVVQHHGGIGTSAQCMMAGVPQLVTPFAHDQFDNAKRLERLGIAKSVKSTGDANAWRQAMRYLTSDTAVRQSCARVRKLMDSEQNAAELIADQILH